MCAFTSPLYLVLIVSSLLHFPRETCQSQPPSDQSPALLLQTIDFSLSQFYIRIGALGKTGG